MHRADGRFIELLRVPAALASAVEAEARRRGGDVATVAGDLIAEVLPDALADAARDLLSFPDAAAPLAAARGARFISPRSEPAASVAADSALQLEPGGATPA